LAAKTVTVQSAGPRARRVTVDDWVFPIGEPVRDVPDAIYERLADIPGVTLHAVPSHRKSDDDDQPGGSS
jgi:hypothetical protein